MKKHLFYVAIIIIILVLIGVYGGGEKEQGEIKIGGLFGQTGYVSFAGESSRNGFTLAIEDAGLNPEDFPVEDFQSDLKNVVTSVNKLVSIDGVNVIVGPEWAEFSEVALTVASKKGIPVISPWMNTEEKWMGEDNFFSMTPSDRAQMAKSLDNIQKSGGKKVGIVYTKNTWSLSVADSIREEIENNYTDLSLSLDVVASAGINDYRTEILKIKESDLDAVMLIIEGGSHPDALIRQMQEQGVDIPTYMPSSLIDVILANSGGELTDYGVYYAIAKEHDRAQEFKDKYKARFGVEPLALTAATTYDITTLLLMAMEDGAKDTGDIIKYLGKVKDFDGYSGNIEFDSNGIVIAGETELRRVVGSGYETIDF